MPVSQKILIVDDDASVTESLSILVKRHGYTPLAAFNAGQALALFKEQGPALVIQDMNFSRSTSGDEGLALLESLRAHNGQVPIILITAWASVDLAVEGMKRGANDFIAKPWNNARLLQAVNTALTLRAGDPELALSRAQLDARYDFANIVGEDPQLLKILNTVGRISNTDAPVLILGESGTGKELIADAIHNNSARRRSPHVKVNLGGIPSNLFESEMFGHVKGAFTDARSDRQGYFAAADAGTLFLDEIGELEKSCQVKLLRVLQDQSYQALGSSQTRQADVRLIAATNQDLAALAADNQFREDLLYRINLITLHLPPLRERPGDVPLIAKHVLEQLCRRYGYADLAMTRQAMQWLGRQPWPGNIRQLTQTIERAALMSDGSELDMRDFLNSQHIGESTESSSPNLPVGSMTLDELEKAMIEKALRQYQNNLTQVASALGLSRQSLYRRLEKHGVRV